MYTIVFYEDKNGNSQVLDYLKDLQVKSKTDKSARIQYKQASLYINLLSENGTRLNDNITKYIGDGIWELRPGNNRIFYFYFENDIYVLLHQFRKKTMKTPKREIDRAKQEKDDYIKRRETL